MLFQRIKSDQRKLISISFQNTRNRSWTLKIGSCSATLATDFNLGECYCNSASGGQNSKSWLFSLSAYSEKSHWTLLPKHFWLFVSTGIQTCPNFMGSASQSVQTEQLGKEFLDPGLNFWGCERGGRKKTQQTCSRLLWNPGLQYITFHWEPAFYLYRKQCINKIIPLPAHSDVPLERCALFE